MKKVNYYKHPQKNFVCLMIANNLFDKDDEFLSKLLKMIKLFNNDGLTMICNFFANNNDNFSNDLNKLFGNRIKTLFTKRKLFSKTEYGKKQVSFNEKELNEILVSAIKYDASPEIEARDEQGLLLFQMVLNDNEGTFINFNIKELELNQIKTKINQILND